MKTGGAYRDRPFVRLGWFVYKNPVKFDQIQRMNGGKTEAGRRQWIEGWMAHAREEVFTIQEKTFVVAGWPGGTTPVGYLADLLRRATGYHLSHGHPSAYRQEWIWRNSDEDLHTYPIAFRGTNTEYYSWRDVVPLVIHRRVCVWCGKKKKLAEFHWRGFYMRGERITSPFCSNRCAKQHTQEALWLEKGKQQLQEVKMFLRKGQRTQVNQSA